MNKISILTLLIYFFNDRLFRIKKSNKSNNKYADTVLKNGAIYTVDEKNPNAQASLLKMVKSFM